MNGIVLRSCFHFESGSMASFGMLLNSTDLLLVSGSADVMENYCREGAGGAMERPPMMGKISKTGSKTEPFWCILSKL